MARLPALVDAIALHDRRGRPTIAHIAKSVRTAKLIDSTKRGAGSSIMTFTDAATLLLAVCGDSSPQGAVEAVQRLRALQPGPDDQVAQFKREDLPDHLGFLRPKLKFVDAVEQMIIHAPTIAKWEADYMKAWDNELRGVSEAEFSMERTARRFGRSNALSRPAFARPVRIVFQVPGVAAEIHLGRLWKQLEEDDAFHEYYAEPSTWKAMAPPSSKPSTTPTTDCLITIEVGVPSLLALHNAVESPG